MCSQSIGSCTKTVRNISQVTSSAPDFAAAQKIISENPSKAVVLSKIEHTEMQTSSAEQFQAFLNEAKATDVYVSRNIRKTQKSAYLHLHKYADHSS